MAITQPHPPHDWGSSSLELAAHGWSKFPCLCGTFWTRVSLAATHEQYFLQSRPRAKCWWTEMKELGYDPLLGYGYVLTWPDGAPAIQIWVHVDDFAIHCPDKTSTTQTLHVFLDAAVNLGLLCHPKKLKPPSQTPLYTGFVFDTCKMPML